MLVEWRDVTDFKVIKQVESELLELELLDGRSKEEDGGKHSSTLVTDFLRVVPWEACTASGGEGAEAGMQTTP